MNDTTRKRYDVISLIVDRGEAMLAKAGITHFSRMTLFMDIDNADKSCPLDLDRFLTFDDFNFAHDFAGIIKHMNRTTAKLEGCFLPRCAKVCSEPATTEE
jgi:hypothetical protein